MTRTRWRSPAIATLVLALALSATAEMWTNTAGFAMEATPLALNGATVTLRLPSGIERKMPLHSFLPEEQLRLKEFLGVLDIPGPLRSTYRLAESQLESARALRDDQAITAEEFRLRKETILQGFLRECTAKSFDEKSAEVQRLLQKLDP
ncbi:MAG: hypothetical protein V2A34_09490 [Lentisphaerota bacterium]